MMASRQILETTGPMREEFFLYCEEIDWFLRATALGMRLGFSWPGRLALPRHDDGYNSDLKTHSRLAAIWMSATRCF